MVKRFLDELLKYGLFFATVVVNIIVACIAVTTYLLVALIIVGLRKL